MDVDLLELDEDFVFEPTAWDLAFAIGIGADPETDRPALDELADAMLVSMPDGERLEALTDVALDAIWSDELETMMRDGLERLRGREDWRTAAEASLVELGIDARAAEVSREVVRHLAMELSHKDTRFFFCVDCLDERIACAGPAGRRRIALEAAIVARRDAAVPPEELVAALRAPATMATLGTRERRLAVRQRLGRLAAFGCRSLRSLAPELQSIADEPLPDAAADDDVWNVVCVALLAEVAAPELN